MLIFDALIIGGGPAGATAALLLAEAGWSVAIVEKKMFPRQKVCGEFISVTSLPLLQKFGLEDFYFKQGGPEICRVGFFTKEVILAAAMPKATGSLNHWGRALEREYLDSILLDKASQAGAQRFQPFEVKNIEKNTHFFTSTISSNGKTQYISARTVIMANGSWERDWQTPYPHHHLPSDLLAFKTHFKNCDLSPDLMPLLAFPGGYGGLVHSSKDRTTLSCCIRRDVLQNARKKYPGLSAGEVLLKYIQSVCLGARQVFAQAKQDGHWLAIGPIRPGIRKCYKDKIFFIGNIAGEAHPIVAEGISMAMQSAWLLSQILLTHQNKLQDLSQIGHTYTKQWHKCFATRIHAATLFAQLAMNPTLITMALPILKKFPQVLTFGAKWSGKINQIVPLISQPS